MKKKLVLIISTLLLVLTTLTACGENDNNSRRTPDSSTPTEASSVSVFDNTTDENSTEAISNTSDVNHTVNLSYTDFIESHSNDATYFTPDGDNYCYMKSAIYPNSGDELFDRCTTYNLVTYDDFGLATSSKYKIVFENATDAQTAYSYYTQLMHMPLYSEGFVLFDTVIYFHVSAGFSTANCYATTWQLFAVFEEYEQTYHTEMEKSEDLHYYKDLGGNEYYLSNPPLQEDYEKLNAYYSLAELMVGTYHSESDNAYVSISGSNGYGYEEYAFSITINENISFYGSYADSYYDICFDDTSITLFWEETEYNDSYEFVPTGKTATIRLEKVEDSIQIDIAFYNEPVTQDTIATISSESTLQATVPLMNN